MLDSVLNANEIEKVQRVIFKLSFIVELGLVLSFHFLSVNILALLFALLFSYSLLNNCLLY